MGKAGAGTAIFHDWAFITSDVSSHVYVLV